MISCRDFVAHLGAYLEGDVAEELRAALEAHLATCATCQVVIDSSKKTFTIVTDAGEFELSRSLPDQVTARIMQRIRTAPAIAGAPDEPPSD
ncbi:MAG: zf-HC2 domain-containing protein [Vicinamibacterales bacterium]